jgi:hypothetical protein
MVGFTVVEPGKRVFIMFIKESFGFQVAEPSGLTVKPGGRLLGFVKILVSLLVSEIVAQLSVKEIQLSLFAFLRAF